MGNLTCPVRSCPLWKKYHCKSTTEHVKIHKFPINPKIRARWEEFVSQQNGEPYKSKRYDGLCTSHFAVQWMMPSGRITLHAVPSIAPMSTKKLLCKWDASTSKIVQIEATGERTEETTSSVNEYSKAKEEASAKCREKLVKAKLRKEAKVKERLAERLKEENTENTGLDAICCEDLDDTDSILGDESILEDVASSIPDASSTGHSLSHESLSFLETGNSFIPERPKSLDTIANVEQAILREKRLTLLRYQAGLRRIKGLEVLLQQLQGRDDANTDFPSPSKIVSPVSYHVVTSSTVCKSIPPYISCLKPSVPSSASSPLLIQKPHAMPTSSSTLIAKTKSIIDIDLPPPLFDDYN